MIFLISLLSEYIPPQSVSDINWMSCPFFKRAFISSLMSIHNSSNENWDRFNSILFSSNLLNDRKSSSIKVRLLIAELILRICFSLLNCWFFEIFVLRGHTLSLWSFHTVGLIGGLVRFFFGVDVTATLSLGPNAKIYLSNTNLTILLKMWQQMKS